MYLSGLKLRNFRKFWSQSEIYVDKELREPDLDIQFSKWLNVLIGENDSWKTAIIDAIKLILKTHSIERIRLEVEDFHKNTEKLRIECRFNELSSEEAKNFTEWLGIKWDWEEAKTYLKVILEANRKNEKILPFDIKAGADDIWYPLDAEAKEYLKTTYLKPLRDAKWELIPKKGSRLSQILQGHELFKDKNENHSLVEVFAGFKEKIEEYFAKNWDGENVKRDLDQFLKKFLGRDSISKFEITEQKLKNILETLKLTLEDGNLGLWSHNLLFIASELLNLNREWRNGIRLGLIEELEAHLHPQAQLRVVESFQEEKNVQFILTTHSPNLASKVALENLIICGKDTDGKQNVFSLKKGSTKLDDGDYKFLERFLDVTKSNLFFAKGIIMVEWRSEEILIPALAKKIGIDLTQKWISIINVGWTSFLRYAKIFQRNEAPFMKIPVAVITDNDIYPDIEAEKKKVQEEKNETLKSNESELVKFFMGEYWTLEWAIYLSSSLSNHIKNTIKNIHSWTTEFQTDTDFDSKLKGKLRDKSLKKTEIAYKLDQILQDDLQRDNPEIVISEADEHLKYIIDAIKHVVND